MKKLLTLVLALVLCMSTFSFVGCNNDPEFKVGLICLHDDHSTYDKNFIDAMYAACEELGLVTKGAKKELVVVTGIPEDVECYDAATDLVEQGCDVIFADSFGHEDFMIQAARENPDVQFCHATGTKAHTEGLSNFHNAFAHIYQGRYLAGVAGGLKLKEMIENGELTAENYDEDRNVKIGYVGAFTFAEVISGYTSWFLGVKSVVSNVSMYVKFTGSWYDEAEERNAATALINEQRVALLSQHADSMGAPNACELAGIPNVSYNGSTAASCPNTFIVSSRINWVPYFKYMITNTQNGTEFDADYCGTLEDGSVALTELGANAAEGTAEILEQVKAQIIAGTLNVFNTDTFTVSKAEGKNTNATVDNAGILTAYLADVNTDAAFTGDTNVVENGVFYESKYRSAPYFDIQIDGITLLNVKF